MVENGLSHDAALAALTTNPARLLGIQKVMGSIEKGKIGNLVVSDKPIFEEKANIRYVVVDGVVHEYEAKSTKKKSKDVETTEDMVKAALGTWAYNISADGNEITGEISIKGELDNFEGSITIEQFDATAELENIEVNGKELSFTFKIMGATEVSVTGTIDEESLDGTITIPEDGSYPVKADKTSGPE